MPTYQSLLEAVVTHIKARLGNEEEREEAVPLATLFYCLEEVVPLATLFYYLDKADPSFSEKLARAIAALEARL